MLTLSGAPGTYPASGQASSISFAPQYLVSWTSASSSASLPLGTGALLFIEDGSGNLLSDAVLPGNSSGFSGTVNLSSISTTTYPALALRAVLTSSDPNVTPSLAQWELGYTAGPIPLSDVSFTLTGTKTIGSTGGGASLYKTIVATTTDSTGVRALPLEWDLYQLSVSGYSIISESPESPYELSPGASLTADLILSP